MWLSFSTFVCLVVFTWAAPGSTPKLRPTRLAKTDDNVCTTTVCQETATSIKQAMNTSANPCDDFYQYACGGYIKSIEEENYNRFDELEAENLENLQELFKKPHDYQDPYMYKKVKDYYASCIDSEQIREDGFTPLMRLLKMHGGWPVLESNWNEWTSDKWTSVLYQLWQTGVGYDYVYNLRLGVDFYNTSFRPVMIGFPPMTLSLTDLHEGPTSEVYNQHLQTLVKFATIFGADSYQAATDMQSVLRLERALLQAALSSKSQGPSNDIIIGPAVKIGTVTNGMQSNFFSTDYARISEKAEEMFEVGLSKLQVAVPSVNWPFFFKTALQTDSIQNLRIFTDNANYLTKAIKILDSTPKRTVINYLLTRAVLDTNGALIAKIDGTKETRCADEVSLQLPLIVGNMYLNKIFKNETKEVAVDMVSKLRPILRKRIDSVEWMDDATRRKAVEKLQNVEQVVAYPAESRNETFLEKLHQSISVRKNTYFDNRLSTFRFLQQMEMAPFSLSHKEADWYRKASTVSIINANYYPLGNSVYLPAGILQGVFFNADRPQSMNFGGIGAVIGHEFTHGFDNKGRMFNKDGLMDEWWSEETNRKFDEKAQCLVDQFSAVYVPEIRELLNGKKTLGENIADNGGFKQAYDAYLDWTKVNDPEPLLPGLDFNHKQLFWLSSANIWCQKISKYQLLDDVLSDEHSPSKYRINVGFQNFKEFANDFGCKTGSPMNPAKKCAVW